MSSNYGDLINQGVGLPEQFSVQVDYTFFDNWLTKKGTLRQKDINNYIKNIEDVVFEHIGINDKFIVKSSTEKSVSEKKKIEISIQIFSY